MSKFLWSSGSGREELNRYPPPSPDVLWIVNFRERKKTQIETFTLKKQVFSTSILETSWWLVFHDWWLVSHEVCIHIQYFFGHKIKSSTKEHAMWTCFKFWPMKSIFSKLWTNESLIIACLQIYRELLSLATFLRVHSNSKEVSYLSWQNTYPNLKTTCHIKLKFFLWTKLLENLLLAKYLISVAAPLKYKSINNYCW